MRITETRIRNEFQSLEFVRESFPMLTNWGVEDFSVTIHSLGCNYLSALGRSLGFWSMSEYPVKVTQGTAISIRPDVVWWGKPNGSVSLIGEFERFEPGKKQKLIDKARNLLQAHHELGEDSRILLLLTWTLAGVDRGGLDEIRAIAHNGFKTNSGHIVPGIGCQSSFIVAVAVFSHHQGSVKLQGVQL